MVTIKDEGDKIVCDITLPVFVKGAYNLGCVLEARQASSANLSPGLGVIHAAGAAGEDTYTEHAISTHLSYAVVEIDYNQIDTCDSTYAQYDNVPALPYHLNYGAYLRNINVTNPAANVDPDAVLVPGAVGAFSVGVEPTLATEANNLGFNAAASVGLNGTTGTNIFSRAYLRQAYYLANPAGVYQTVAYMIHT